MNERNFNEVFSSNLNYYLDISGKTQAELAKYVGVSTAAVNTWCKGLKNPRMDKTDKICKFFCITRSDLMLEHNHNIESAPAGPVLAISEKEEIDIIEKFRTLDPPGKDHVSSVLDWECDRMNQLVSMKALEKRPARILTYWGKIAAAGIAVDSFSTLAQGTIEVIDTSESRAADYAIGVNGNSMEPDYLNGDIVLVRKATTINSGQVGIFQKGNEIFIKECTDTGLRSRNPDYPDMIDDLEVICLGIVLGRAELVS